MRLRWLEVGLEAVRITLGMRGGFRSLLLWYVFASLFLDFLGWAELIYCVM